MHKGTKLAPKTRTIIYQDWCRNRGSFRSLGRRFHVDKNIIKIVVVRGRLGDFSVHDSGNKRYRSIEYGLRRLARTEERVRKRLARRQRRGIWVDRGVPGELVHADTKRLPYATDQKKGLGISARETLFVLVDDASRWLYADILPDKTGECAALVLETAALRLPFLIGCHYSDNGGEYKGGLTHPVQTLCLQLGIVRKFTKVRHPWTNGKAERVIRTLLEEWLIYTRSMTKDERRRSLYQYIDRYNHDRTHRSLHGLTPAQKLISCLEGGDNA